MKSKALTLTTRFNQNKPLTLADLLIFSKRLNGEEEMQLQELQLEAAAAEPGDIIKAEVDFVADLLRFRAVSPAMKEKVSGQHGIDFVLDNVGKHTSVKLLNYLRTGEGLAPGETLTLPVFKDPEDPSDLGVLYIEDRAFVCRALSYREALHAIEAQTASNALQVAQDAQAMIDRAADMTAQGQAAQPAEGQVTEAQLIAAAEAGETVPSIVTEAARPLSDAEVQAQLASIVAEGKDMLEKAKALTRMTAQVCADYLNARLLKPDLPQPTAPEEQQQLAQPGAEALAAPSTSKSLGQHAAEMLAGQGVTMSAEPIDGAWLLSHLTEADIAQVINYLADGEVNVPDPEDLDQPAPKADGAATA